MSNPQNKHRLSSGELKQTEKNISFFNALVRQKNL